VAYFSPSLLAYFSTVVNMVEGGLVLAVFIPMVFRAGLLVMGIFHVGVWALLGIDFHQYVFVYLGFFLIPAAAWGQQAGEVCAWVASAWNRMMLSRDA